MITELLLALFLGSAAVVDVYQRKIPNILLFVSAFVLGAVYFYEYRVNMILISLFAFSAVFIFTYLLWSLNRYLTDEKYKRRFKRKYKLRKEEESMVMQTQIGGGDAKLLMLIAFFTPKLLLPAMLLGGLAAIVGSSASKRVYNLPLALFIFIGYIISAVLLS